MTTRLAALTPMALLAALALAATAEAGPRSSDNFILRCERLGTPAGTGEAGGKTLHSRVTTGQVATTGDGPTLTGGINNTLAPLPPEDGPDDLAGSPKPGKVELSWTARPAARYQVLRGDEAGGPYAPVGVAESGFYLDLPGGVDGHLPLRGAGRLRLRGVAALQRGDGDHDHPPGPAKVDPVIALMNGGSKAGP